MALKPTNCVCGRRVQVYGGPHGITVRPYHVGCYDPTALPNGSKRPCCWSGPEAETPEEAIEKWNEGMTRG